MKSDQGVALRTIVFSDVHGEPAVIRRVIEHSGYRPDVDRLIFAGDAIEVGRDSWGCLELLEELGVEYLVGNHEYAVWDGRPIETDILDLSVESEIAQHIDSGMWMLAASADGVLVTHAGLCEAFASHLGPVADVPMEDLVAELNDEFAEAVARGPGATGGPFHENGPLWYRPSESLLPVAGVTQVAGHTPPEILDGDDVAGTWASRGLYLIDPFVRAWTRRGGYRLPAPLRYAVIESGEVSLVEDMA